MFISNSSVSMFGLFVLDCFKISFLCAFFYYSQLLVVSVLSVVFCCNSLLTIVFLACTAGITTLSFDAYRNVVGGNYMHRAYLGRNFLCLALLCRSTSLLKTWKWL